MTSLTLKKLAICNGRFRGGRAAPPPPPLGDKLTQSLTVMLANAKF